MNFIAQSLKNEGFWALILSVNTCARCAASCTVQVFGLDALPQADLDEVKRIVLANKGHVPK
jgi:hypothetical protein